jgi:predicted DCC family thiol-disulfide oxidoreductase YuxK
VTRETSGQSNPAAPGSGPEGGAIALPDGLVVFDGLCNFCSGGVNLALALDRRGALKFTPLQSAYGRELAFQHGLNPDDPATFFLFQDGEPLERSTAALAVAARLPAPWRWATILRAMPRGWRDSLYDWIAANRYRLLGKRDTCRLPTPAERERFVLDPPPPGEGVGPQMNSL